MSITTALYKKEVRTYFNTPIGWIYLTAIQFLIGFYVVFFTGFFIIKQADLGQFFMSLPFAFAALVPALTMRLWAEERNLGTAEMLVTLPVREAEIVIAKFLAGLTVIVIGLAVSLAWPIGVRFLVKPGITMDLGPIIGGYISAVLLGAAYLALGFFISSLAGSQIVAFILALVVMAFLTLMGFNTVLILAPRSLSVWFARLSFLPRFESIGKGLIDTRDVIYFLSVVVFFLFATTFSIRRRR